MAAEALKSHSDFIIRPTANHKAIFIQDDTSTNNKIRNLVSEKTRKAKEKCQQQKGLSNFWIICLSAYKHQSQNACAQEKNIRETELMTSGQLPKFRPLQKIQQKSAASFLQTSSLVTSDQY